MIELLRKALKILQEKGSSAEDIERDLLAGLGAQDLDLLEKMTLKQVLEGVTIGDLIDLIQETNA